MVDHSTIVNGNKAEAIVLADLIRRGYHVSVPFSGHSPYDLIFADEWHRLYRLQVKYRTAKNGRIEVPLRSVHTNSKGAKMKPTNLTFLDGFAIYCPNTDEIYYVSIKELLPNTHVFALNVEDRRGKVELKGGQYPPLKPARGDLKNKRWAESYLDPATIIYQDYRHYPDFSESKNGKPLDLNRES